MEGIPDQIKDYVEIESKTHLEEGVKPIIACIGSEEDFDHRFAWDLINQSDQNKNLLEVKYGAPKSELDENNITYLSPHDYLISPIDSRDKVSYDYQTCIGLVVVGIDKETNEQISMLTHQNISSVISSKKIEFIEDLSRHLQIFKDRSKEGTIDAVIFGGAYPEDSSSKKMYEEVKGFTSELCKKEVGFIPFDITGPKVIKKFPEKKPTLAGWATDAWPTDTVFFDTKERRLFVQRDNV
jgi:hypothetical protein